MFRRFVPSSGSACVALLSVATRKIVNFTAQSGALGTQAKTKGYSSLLWFPVDDLKYMKLEPKEKETPTVASLPKLLELYNLDELDAPANVKPLPPTERQSSYKTGKPYGSSLEFELGQRATVKQLQSKYWIHPATARKEGFKVRRDARSALVLLRSETKVFNAEQLVDPAAGEALQISGGSAKLWTGATGVKLRESQVANKFRTGLWFTSKQAQSLHLEIQPGAVGFLVQDEAEGLQVYNLEQVEGGADLAQSLGRNASDEHRFLTSNDRVINEDALTLLEARQFGSKYWLGQQEVDLKGYKIKAGEEPVVIPRARRIEFVVFNADQMVDPEAAFKAAGTLTR